MTHFDALKRFCAYQDRCIHDVEEKLKALGVEPELGRKYIITLQKEGFIDEFRFVESYINGKINIKKWGKLKIKFHLKQKGVNQDLITKGLNNIDDDIYFQNLKDLFKKKELELSNEKNKLKKKQKIIRFLIQKGFDFEEIYFLIQ